MTIMSAIEDSIMCIHNNAMHSIVNGFFLYVIECIFMLTLLRAVLNTESKT